MHDEGGNAVALAEIGVVILLFEIGLESDLGELLRAGLQSSPPSGMQPLVPALPPGFVSAGNIQ